MNSISKDTLLVRARGNKRLVHVKECSFIRNFDLAGFDPLDKFKPGKMQACPTCQKLVLVTLGAKDYLKHAKEYETIFQSVSYRHVEKLYLLGKGKTYIQNNKCFIRLKDDDWYIDLSQVVLGDVHLYHNNYQVNQRTANNDSSLRGYHEHDLKGNTLEQKLNNAFGQICKYNYNEAAKVHQKSRKKASRTFSDLDESEKAEREWGF